MRATDDLLQFIAVKPPGFDASVVAEAVTQQFGLAGDYALLVSERDQNFRLTTASGDRYLVKVTSPVEPHDVTDFQIAALNYLAKCGVSGVPRNVQTTAGENRGSIQSDNGVPLCLRVLTWISRCMVLNMRAMGKNHSGTHSVPDNFVACWSMLVTRLYGSSWRPFLMSLKSRFCQR